MTSLGQSNIDETSTDVYVALEYASMSMREEFQSWLIHGNARKYMPENVLSCMDRVSEYALEKKKVKGSLWKYIDPYAFNSVYNKLIGDKILRFNDRKTHKLFITAGKLYLRFLKEKPYDRKNAASIVDKDKEVEMMAVSSPLSKENVDPEDVIKWLVTQPNTNGTLYLENVVRQYMRALRSAPAKFEISDGLDNRDVFMCLTAEDLISYWDKCKTAPNYKQVNSSISGMFSAGMGCLLRYLQDLSKPTPETEMTDKPDVIQLIERLGLEYEDKRNSGGALWVIGGRELNKIMIDFRDSGFYFWYKEGGGKSSNFMDAWWHKDTSPHLTNVYSVDKPNPTLDPTIIMKLTEVLSSRFANGYRLNSPIELVRLKTFVATDVDVKISLSDEELEKYVSVCGITYKDKIYVVSNKAIERIRVLVDEYLSSGARAIFYEEFYKKNENWLFEEGVVSDGILLDVLRKMFPKLSFTQTYFGCTNVSISVVLESEIHRVWGDETLLSYWQLAERLTYIPLARIKQILAQNGDFIWNSVEVYSHIRQIQISDEEREAIRKAAESLCNAHGYVSIIDLPAGGIRERNYEFSETAIHSSVYRICLLDKFDKRGKIITRKGDIVDVRAILNNYCSNIDRCSLRDLLDFEKELTGEVHRWIPMEAGNAFMIRVDKDNYVADRFVDFNTDLIDKAIDLFVRDDYLPLKAFTTFGAFPDCGHTWNLFLLESYCRRFSNKYRFDVLSVNSRNAGAVIRKSCNMSYKEIMIDAVANADVPLKDINVGCFLMNSGYTGRYSKAKANEIINAAKIIRERRS